MERLAYYGTRMYSEQLGDSQRYTELKHCTVIGLLRGHIFGFGQAVKPQEKMHHVSESVHYDDHDMPFYPGGDPVVCHILELDRFANNADALYTVNGNGKQRKLTPELFGWLRFFREGAAEDFMEKYADTDSCIKKAKKEYEKFIKTQRLREAQLRHDMWLHDRAQEKYDAKEEGRAEGRIEGGRETALATALAMKNDGLSASKIAQYTGLSEDEIAKL